MVGNPLGKTLKGVRKIGEKLSPFSGKEKTLESTNQSPTDSSPDHNNDKSKNSTSDYNESPISKNNNNYSRENNAELIKTEVKHPKIENFMIEAEAKTSGALDMF
jgi:protein required for attachment to host cells